MPVPLRQPGRAGGRLAVAAVVFDLDGTLVDSYGAITECFNHARTRLGRKPLPESKVRRLVGHGLEQLMDQAVGSELAPRAVRLFRERYARIATARTTALPGVCETLEVLATRGIRLGVATNKPARFARPILKALGLTPPIEVIAGPDARTPPKPEPDMVNRVMATMGIAPSSALYVGDMPVDVETARRAGLPVWLIATGSRTRIELRRAGADRILGRFGELAERLSLAPAPNSSRRRSRA